MSGTVVQVSPSEASKRTDWVVVDVRERHEVDLVRLPGSIHVPLRDLPHRWNQLPANRPLLLLCHHGMRSQRAAEFLVHQGLNDVSNLSGGIDRWAREVDPSLPRY